MPQLDIDITDTSQTNANLSDLVHNLKKMVNNNKSKRQIGGGGGS